jgi:hypothetical protein
VGNGGAVLDSVVGTAENLLREGATRAVRLGTRVVELIPIDELLQRLPIEQIVERIPIEQIVARIPIGELVEQIPIERMIARIDINALVAQIDIDALLARIDIGRLVGDALKGIDFEELIRASTVSAGSEVRDVARTQMMNGDLLVARIVDRLLRRDERQLDVGPPGLAPLAP